MKIIVILALFGATQALCLDSPQPQPSITTLIEESDWPALQKIVESKTNLQIKMKHLSKAELMVCKTQKKCYRSCAFTSIAITFLIASTTLEDTFSMPLLSNTVAFINRGSYATIGLFGKNLIGETKKHIHARRILELLKKKNKRE